MMPDGSNVRQHLHSCHARLHTLGMQARLGMARLGTEALQLRSAISQSCFRGSYYTAALQDPCPS